MVRQQPNLATAAEILGITEEALKDTLGDPSQGPPDFAASAAKLSISEADLRDALGAPENNGQPPAERP